ncbi:aminoacyl-histidine dipeptidase [Bacteroidia bacterium]|nr:aminoacyl-histidine dipeptidase [Bacteroidia bacterium]GHV22426.1 aminoacyl-histidine dipeptidase [Bacteroidia bacterium]
METIKNLAPANVWKHFYSLTQIPRPSGQMKEIIAFIEMFGKRLNLETKTDPCGNVVIRKPATPGYENRPTVILQGHLDMVPQKNSDTKFDFSKDSIDAYIDGDWVKAKGTTLGADNGIGVATAMAILEANDLQHGPIEALFTIDEETGMDGAFAIKPGFITGTIMLNMDSEDEGELYVGCAGGADLNISFLYKDDANIPEGDIAVKLSLTGLKGGHSGVDINLGRANANKLMFRFLKDAVQNFGARLASIDGGSLRNAIPREAFAVITIPGDDEINVFWEMVSEYRELYNLEYARVEENIKFTAEKIDLPKALIPEEIQDALINAVVGCPNGTERMLTDFPDTVESSSNLALIKSSEGLIDIKILVRSSSETRKEALCSSLESVFALAGAKVEFGNAYPGWNPNIDSPILATMKRVHKEKFGMEPEVKVMHAGLECGIIMSNIPGLDVISFGPTIKNPHSPDEKVNIVAVRNFWEFLVETLSKL